MYAIHAVLWILLGLFLCAFGCDFPDSKICYFDFACFESSSLCGDVAFHPFFGSVVINFDVFSLLGANLYEFRLCWPKSLNLCSSSSSFESVSRHVRSHIL